MNLLLFAPVVDQNKEVQTQVSEIQRAGREELFSRRDGKPRMGKSCTPLWFLCWVWDWVASTTAFQFDK